MDHEPPPHALQATCHVPSFFPELNEPKEPNEPNEPNEPECDATVTSLCVLCALCGDWLSTRL
jgi:hypothetical protein